jgi:hypothetical protein
VASSQIVNGLTGLPRRGVRLRRGDIVAHVRFFHQQEIKMAAKKQSSSDTSSLAGKILAGKKATPAEAKKLAASVLSQDEKKGR